MELKEAENKNKKSYIWIDLAIVCAIILLLWFQYSRSLQFGINNATVEKDNVDPFTSAVMPIITIIGIIGSLYMYQRQASASEKQIPFIERQASAAEKQASIMDKQASDNEKNSLENKNAEFFQNYSQAIDQLGSENMIVRLGAISKLEMIANKSDEYYWPIMEILTAYIREKSSIENKHQSYLNEDIQAILSVIRKRKYFLNNGENKGLDLHKTYLKEANLEGANLEGTNLEGAYLRQAQLKGADLRQARLKEAELIEAHLEEAHLEGVYLEETYLGVPDMNPRVIHLERAHLEEAHLRGVNLFFANLEGAHLEGAHLEGTNFIVAHLERSHLKRANLKGADLQGSCLEGADLEGADLEGAELENVDLRGAVNLTIEQLLKVKTLYKTKLDEKLLERLRIKTEYRKLSENPHLEKA